MTNTCIQLPLMFGFALLLSGCGTKTPVATSTIATIQVSSQFGKVVADYNKDLPTAQQRPTDFAAYAVSDAVLQSMAERYQKAFDEPNVDAIVALLKRECSLSNQGGDGIYQLQVHVKPNGFGIGVAQIWIGEMQRQLASSMAADKLLRELRTVHEELKTVESQLEQLKQRMPEVGEPFDNVPLGSGSGIVPSNVNPPSEVSEAEQEWRILRAKHDRLQTLATAIQDKIVEAELMMSQDRLTVHGGKLINILRAPENAAVSEDDVEDYRRRRLSCPELPPITLLRKR